MCRAYEQMEAIKKAEEIAIGEANGGLKKLKELVETGIITSLQAAEGLGITEEEFLDNCRAKAK